MYLCRLRGRDPWWRRGSLPRHPWLDHRQLTQRGVDHRSRQTNNISKTQNPDLFWTIRGAGMNFGVIVNATYQVHDLTKQGKVQVVDFVFPKE